MQDLDSLPSLIHPAFEDAPEAVVIADTAGCIRQANLTADVCLGQGLGGLPIASDVEIRDDRGVPCARLALLGESEDDDGLRAAERLARLLADWAGLALAGSRRHRDPLTGLPDAPGFHELAEQQFKEARRYGRKLSLLALTIDGFEAIVEDRGDGVAEGLVEDLAELLRDLLRGSDIAGRLNEASFALLLPETGAQGAADLAGRLTAALEEASGGDVGVSIGLTEIAPPDARFAEPLARVLQACAQAQRQGHKRPVAA